MYICLVRKVYDITCCHIYLSHLKSSMVYFLVYVLTSPWCQRLIYDKSLLEAVLLRTKQKSSSKVILYISMPAQKDESMTTCTFVNFSTCFVSKISPRIPRGKESRKFVIVTLDGDGWSESRTISNC